METYKCSKCGMSVNANCGQCNAPLVNDVLKLDDGREVQISKCPNGHGKIKSPLCCGEDMNCAIQGSIKEVGVARLKPTRYDNSKGTRIGPSLFYTSELHPKYIKLKKLI